MPAGTWTDSSRLASMTLRGWSYRYVGPVELRSLVRPDGEGRSIRSPGDFDAWVSARTVEELAEPFTFVVDRAEVLRLAPRRSEHVVCAGGEAVLGACRGRKAACGRHFSHAAAPPSSRAARAPLRSSSTHPSGSRPVGQPAHSYRERSVGRRTASAIRGSRQAWARRGSGTGRGMGRPLRFIVRGQEGTLTSDQLVGGE